MTCRDAALEYAQRDWHIFPLWPIRHGQCACGTACGRDGGKHPLGPLVPHGVLDATTDQFTIRQWWDDTPDANIGLATGARSGFVVLDEDGDQGAESRRALERRYGPLLDTVVNLTGRGGQHHCFCHPGGWVPNAVGLWPGLDVRGDGGYIVAPPSRTVGPYAWRIGHEPDAIPMAAAPAWLLDHLHHHATDRLRADGTPLLLREGERNRRLFQLGSAQRRYGVGTDIIRTLLETVNRAHCVPPLAADEVARIAASAGRYAPAARCGACGAPLPEDGAGGADGLDADARLARALGVL